MTYTLKVTETGNKAAKYHYQVIDETGKVISERRSNREYVACTIDGLFYFGRLDLIGKGDHGKLIKNAAVWKREIPAIAYIEQGFSMTDAAIEAFEAYKDVKVTWPDGRTRTINRKGIEEFWEQPVSAKNLKNGYPFCKIETL